MKGCKDCKRVKKVRENLLKFDREKHRIYAWNRKIEAINKYGGKCKCCGITEPEFLAIDHIKGNGNQHRKEIGNTRIYIWLKRESYPKGFQILCHNCNMAKTFWKICPHKR